MTERYKRTEVKKLISQKPVLKSEYFVAKNKSAAIMEQRVHLMLETEYNKKIVLNIMDRLEHEYGKTDEVLGNNFENFYRILILSLDNSSTALN